MSPVAVIFDFDGVIADTEPLHLAATQQVLARHGLNLPAKEYQDRYLGYNDHDLFAALSSHRALKWTGADIDALVAGKGRAFETLISGQSVVYPAAASCITRLFSEDVPLAIASGAFASEIEAILSAAGLRRHFRAIVGAGDYAAGKPSPEPFLEAARRLGVAASAAIAIEDSQWGLDAARAAGCSTIAVTHTYPRHALTADVIVDSLDEVDEKLVEFMRVKKFT